MATIIPARCEGEYNPIESNTFKHPVDYRKLIVRFRCAYSSKIMTRQIWVHSPIPLGIANCIGVYAHTILDYTDTGKRSLASDYKQ